MPDCTLHGLRLSDFKRRVVEARFDGGAITSDGGSLLLREVERRTGLLRDISRRLSGPRAPRRAPRGGHPASVGARTAGALARCRVRVARRCWLLHAENPARGPAAGRRLMLGLAVSDRLERLSAPWLDAAEIAYKRTGAPARFFTEDTYQARSWRWASRLLVKAEHNRIGRNVRFIVTNLGGAPRHLYKPSIVSAAIR